MQRVGFLAGALLQRGSSNLGGSQTGINLSSPDRCSPALNEKLDAGDIRSVRWVYLEGKGGNALLEHGSDLVRGWLRRSTLLLVEIVVLLLLTPL